MCEHIELIKDAYDIGLFDDLTGQQIDDMIAMINENHGRIKQYIKMKKWQMDWRNKN
jgi:hypothetical protein